MSTPEISSQPNVIENGLKGKSHLKHGKSHNKSRKKRCILPYKRVTEPEAQILYAHLHRIFDQEKPYSTVQDNVLMRIACRAPISEDELRTIPSVGPTKAEKFNKIFVPAILEFLREKDMKSEKNVEKDSCVNYKPAQDCKPESNNSHHIFSQAQSQFQQPQLLVSSRIGLRTRSHAVKSEPIEEKMSIGSFHNQKENGKITHLSSIQTKVEP